MLFIDPLMDELKDAARMAVYFGVLRNLIFFKQKPSTSYRSRGGVTIHDIHDLKKVVKREGIKIAVIAVPAASAQQVLNLVVAGILGILAGTAAELLRERWKAR